MALLSTIVLSRGKKVTQTYGTWAAGKAAMWNAR